ncbi:acylphosphatase-2 isoform X3 [Monodelphis domestica]|nr:acylphosphatase-2 isoform X3 [Monodelphis domestica]
MAPLPLVFLGASVSRLLPQLLRPVPSATAAAAAMSTAKTLKSVDYEVFGRVQGVCFRMYTEGEAKKTGVVGWVKNTSQGTVKGQVQGPEDKVNSMLQCHRHRLYPYCCIHVQISFSGHQATSYISERKNWLSKVGSPSSRIDRTDFSNEKTISELDYTNFSIKY